MLFMKRISWTYRILTILFSMLFYLYCTPLHVFNVMAQEPKEPLAQEVLLQALKTLEVDITQIRITAGGIVMENEDTEQIAALASIENYTTTMLLKRRTSEGLYENYLAVETILTPESEEFNFYGILLNRMQDFLDIHMRESSISIALSAKIPGKLSERQRNKVSKELLKNLKGHKVHTMKEGNVVSITGFSPNLKPPYLTPQGPVNLNIAFRYNGYEDVTILWLGSPLIAGSY